MGKLLAFLLFFVASACIGRATGKPGLRSIRTHAQLLVTVS